MIHARTDKQEDGTVNARTDAPGNHWLCEACSNACLAILPPQTFCITCLKGKLMGFTLSESLMLSLQYPTPSSSLQR